MPQRASVAVSVRDAEPADHPAIRDVLGAAYREYASLVPPQLFDRYLQDLLDLDPRARDGQLVVAELAGRVVGAATFYADASVEGFGWPPGWAGVRAVGVDPAARRLGVAQALMDACLQRALAAGAPALCLHTAEFMTAPVAMYEAMGFRRAPAFDFDVVELLGLAGIPPVRVIAYRLDLRPPA
jgi:GNAT superfamily N-acetyltransferase